MCMDSDIPVTEARARFSELVNRVGFGHERITLTRHGKPLVTLIPAEADPATDDVPAETTVLDLASRSTPASPNSYTLIARGPQAPQN
jgi:prevent-host-death family protein